MATTTNYGWTTPDDTALVKDGAAAIRTLGSSIDTTTKALNPSTTLGDIEYRSSTANTNTRLGIGSTGNVLTVSGGVPTWAAPSSGSMTLLSTTTLSGASTTISGISGSYNDLLVLISGITNATADGANRIAPNGTTNISALSGMDGFTFAYINKYIWLGYEGAKFKRDDANNCFALLITNYASSTTVKPVSVNGIYYENLNFGTMSGCNGAGGINTTSAITSLVFTNTGGNFSTGTVLVYGVK